MLAMPAGLGSVSSGKLPIGRRFCCPTTKRPLESKAVRTISPLASRSGVSLYRADSLTLWVSK
jgi:hypothetical protein